MQQQRIIYTNNKPHKSGPVLYWMDRDMRVNDNWALLHAQALAEHKQAPLIVVYNLIPNFLHGTARQWDFKVRGLQEVADQLSKLHIPFAILLEDEKKNSAEMILEFCQQRAIGTIVTDFAPLRQQRAYKTTVAEHFAGHVVIIDAHNIVPCVVASGKQEYGAYTLRPKLYALLPTFLDEYPAVRTQKYQLSTKLPHIDFTSLLQHPAIDRNVAAIDWLQPGEHHAQQAARDFISQRLSAYATKRNDPNVEGQSNLSPYLHYGMISAQRIALLVLEQIGSSIDRVLHRAKNKAAVDEKKSLQPVDHAAAFLEELIIRRELSDNFCYYNQAYDSVDGFPDWAKKSHAVHQHDVREFVYTLEQFERAQTHDPLWNAAQREMVHTGKMHGYMRMYWAKKILEWSASPQEAMRIAIYLNDKYELDGRDPNGYAGIAWSIGGVHDRAWFTRPIYGTVRYMARSGCEKKFDTDAYIAKYS